MPQTTKTPTDPARVDPVDRTRTIEELEAEAWGEPDTFSCVAVACHRLRKVPLEELSLEEIRILVEQGVGLPFVLPLALELLEDDPLAEGDLHRGDLLATVVAVKPEIWQENEALLHRLTAVVERAEEVRETLAEKVLPAYEEIFRSA